MYDGNSWMWHGGWGGWALMVVLMAVFWATVITLALMAIRYLAPERGRNAATPAHDVEVLLAERYARGEIDDDEYRQRLTLLREHR